MKLLVVDNASGIEPVFLRAFESHTHAFTFLFAKDSIEAVGYIRATPDLSIVLLDIDEPVLDGLTLLSELPQLNPSLRAVVMTDSTDTSRIRTAMNHGAFDFLSKPLDTEDLRTTISRTADYLKEAREKQHVRSMDELKSRFFDNITHEFRTPLTLILGPVEKLLRDVTDESQRQKLQLVQRNARQLLRITNQLLDLARLEAGYLTVSSAPGNLGLYLERLVDAFQSLAEERNIRLTFENRLTANYYFDAEKIEHILHNLLANALKFTVPDPVSGDAGEVTVLLMPRTEPQPNLWRHAPTPENGIHTYSPPRTEIAGEEGIRLLVKDSGVGIQPKRLPHVFDRFHMLNPKHLRPDVALVQPSTGIGLAFVKELIELMQGTISVSSAIHQGTLFAIELPLAVAPETTAEESAAPSLPVLDWHPLPDQETTARPDPAKEAPLVLVVEDDSELRAFIADELSAHYKVITAADGKIGWAFAQAELPDVVVSDVAMPNMDGFQLTSNLKSHPSTDHIAVLLLTSKTNEKDILTGLEQGADVYLPKPFHLEELHLRIRNLLTHQQKLQQYHRQQLISNEPPAAETVQDKFLQSIYAMIEERLDDSSLSVENMAEKLNISRKTLYRKINGLTQLSPNELIRQYRLRKAAELLKNGHNASETAYMVGFETPSYFGQCFKDQYGVTPKDYVTRLTA
jgi:signal transduction histidine kinase/AraC-like DNA-binding protein